MVVLASPSGRRALSLVALLGVVAVIAVGCRPGGEPARPTSAATMAVERPDLVAAAVAAPFAPPAPARGAGPAPGETSGWSAGIVAR